MHVFCDKHGGSAKHDRHFPSDRCAYRLIDPGGRTVRNHQNRQAGQARQAGEDAGVRHARQVQGERVGPGEVCHDHYLGGA